MRLGAAHHALAPPILDDRLRGFGPRPVVAMERTRRKVAIKLRAIGGELHLKSVKDFFGQAARIGRRRHHQWRHRADDGRLRHPALAVPSQIAHHFAAAGGMADMNGVLQIEMRRQGRKVVCIVIHVMAVARLAGPAVAAAVMGDDSIAVIQEEQHLPVPVIGRQRPTMAEYDGLTRAPVLVIDCGAVFGRNRWHRETPLWLESNVPPPRHSGATQGVEPGMTNSKSVKRSADQANAGTGRNRLIAPMIMRMKNTSTMPCTTANTGPDGGLPGASAVNAGTLRKLWITSTNTL